MKKILFFAAQLLATHLAIANNSPLVQRSFWEANPDLNTVQAELSKGFDFSSVHGMEDPIALALRYNVDPSIFKLLVDQPGVNLNQMVHEGRIYLHLAANSGNAQAVDYLIEKGSDVDFKDAHDHTALTFAGYQGHLTKELIDVFIAHGLDIKKKYEQKNDANILLLAMPYDSGLVITDYLISKGLDLNSVDNDGLTAFHYASQIGIVENLKELKKRGVKYDDRALIVASKGTYRSANSLDTYQYLIEELKISPKATDESGKNVLHSIVRKKDQTEVVAYFLKKGVDVNTMDKDGNTPFMLAAGADNFEVVELMLPAANLKKVNAQNKKGETALMMAVERGNANTVDVLLKSGADANLKDKEGNTAAYYFIASYRTPGGRFRGNPEDLVKAFNQKRDALKNAGLDFSAAQSGGKNIYHLAAAKNDLALYQSIADLGANINAIDKDGNTALQTAAMVATDDKVLKYLIANGADKSAETAFGETPYDLAMQNESLKKKGVSVEFLKKS